MHRREFIGSAGRLAALVATSSAVAHGAPREKDDGAFSFCVFGDTHFDRLEHHDFDWMKQAYEKDISQVRN
jgi:hypothetical protein